MLQLSQLLTKNEIYILPKNHFGRPILVGQHPYEITLVRLSVRLLLTFLKIGSIVFSDIVHDDS